jgi:regulator of cell morphogenesis and NO signaling
MNPQAIQHLLQEHERARRIMLALETLLEGLAQDPQWTAARTAAFEEIRRGLTQDLCRLIRKENELLYPLLEPHFERDSGPLANLRAEHAFLSDTCRLLCEAAKNLRPGDNPLPALREFQTFGSGAVEVLRNHLYKEERVLFPMAARLLTAEQNAELLRRMQALEDAPPQEPASS